MYASGCFIKLFECFEPRKNETLSALVGILFKFIHKKNTFLEKERESYIQLLFSLSKIKAIYF